MPRIAIVKCHDCGTELQRSNPVEPKDEVLLIFSGALQNFRCPKGCRATHSDMNANVDYEWTDAPLDAAKA